VTVVVVVAVEVRALVFCGFYSIQWQIVLSCRPGWQHHDQVLALQPDLQATWKAACAALTLQAWAQPN